MALWVALACSLLVQLHGTLGSASLLLCVVERTHVERPDGVPRRAEGDRDRPVDLSRTVCTAALRASTQTRTINIWQSL